MTVSVHTAGIAEIEVIRTLIHRIWKPTYREILSEEQMDYMLDMMYRHDVLLEQMQAGHIFLIITEGGTPVGFAGYECDYKGEKGTCKLHKIYVLPETQGKGIGKILLHTIAEEASEAGQQRLLLNVNRYNKAKDFYAKLGFSIVAEEDIDIGSGYFMNDYLMTRALQ